MAIGPDVLKKKIIDESKAFESQIDDALRNSDMNDKNQIRMPVPKGMTRNHWSVIKPKYSDKGWSQIEWLEGSGTTLVFTAPGFTDTTVPPTDTHDEAKHEETNTEQPKTEPHAEDSETRQ